jgi:hypothetical protein
MNDKVDPMPYEDIDQDDPSVCKVPSCRWRGLDHSGLCKEIDGEVEFDGRGLGRAPKADEQDEQSIAALLNRLAVEFDKLCIERHEKGQEEYGVFTFLGNDVIRMMLEELADTTNYCRMQAIKLMLLQEALEGQLAENPQLVSETKIAMGWQAFKGTSEAGWVKK